MSHPRLKGLELLSPWEDASEGLITGAAAELQREVGPGHPLFGRSVYILARRMDSDDVLVEAPGLPQPYAVVHLTWTGTREVRPAWPHTTLFNSLQHWVEEGMRADHLDYTGGDASD